MSATFIDTAPIPVVGFRHMLEELIDLCVLLLDQLDGDADLEENGDLEPCLGAYCPGNVIDGEDDPFDTEPSLGSPDRMVNQERWADHIKCDCCFGYSDREHDDCDKRTAATPNRTATSSTPVVMTRTVS